MIGNAAALPGALGYEQLLAAGDPGAQFPDHDERATALVTYSSGTTGRPKGVPAAEHLLVAAPADPQDKDGPASTPPGIKQQRQQPAPGPSQPRAA